MNILIGVPTANSNLTADAIKTVFESSINQDDQLFLSTDELTQKQLDDIEIFVGNNIESLNRLLTSKESKLKWVQTLSAGVDNFPLQQLKDKQIVLSTVNGIHAEPIAESIIGMILSMYRGIAASAKKSEWFKPTQELQMLQGKKVVIYGTGHIGSRAAEILDVFHANVVGINSTGHDVSGFKQTVAMTDSLSVVSEADIIINALPLTPKTTHLFNESLFRKLKRQPLFVNIGRGPSVVTDDLVKALNQKQLGAVALDVTDPEPLESNHPLWQMENVLITPHISGIHAEYLAESVAIFKRNLESFEQDGEIIQNKVDYNKGY